MRELLHPKPMQDSREYRAIATHCRTRTTKRSGVPLIRHIDQGLAILRYTGATERAQPACCLHPLVQTTADLAASYQRLDELSHDIYVIALALDYRHIANATLSTRPIASAADIPLSPL